MKRKKMQKAKLKRLQDYNFYTSTIMSTLLSTNYLID